MFESGGTTVIAPKESGLRHFQIAAINPTKAELEAKGIKVKEEPKRTYQWSVPVIIEGNTVTVTAAGRETIEKYCERVTGQSLSSLYTVNELPKDTKLQASLVQVEFLLESDGKYFRKLFRWFNDARIVNLTYQKGATKTEGIAYWPAMAHRRKMFDPQFGVRMFDGGVPNSTEGMAYPVSAFIPAPASAVRFDNGKQGVGDFLDLANLIKAFMRTRNMSVKTSAGTKISAFDPSIDLFAAFGGQNFIDGDMSVVKAMIDNINAEYKPKERGFIGYVGIAFSQYKDMLNKNQAVAELYQKVVFNTNGSVKLDPPALKQIQGKVTDTGVYTIPGLTKARELTPEELNEMQIKFYNNNQHLIKTKSKSGGSKASAPKSDVAADGEDATVDQGNDWPY